MSFKKEGLDISDFAMGFGFQVNGDDGFTSDDAWNLLFEALPTDLMAGAELYEAWDSVPAVGVANNGTPVPQKKCCICTLNNLSLKRFRKLYPIIEQNARIQSHMALYRPIYQSNRLEQLKTDFLPVGSVSQDGSVRGDTLSRGKMRFTGSAPKKRFCPRTVYVYHSGYGNVLSEEQATRCLARLAGESFPETKAVLLSLPDGEEGTADAIIRSVRGRYAQTSLTGPDGQELTATYGVLPDRSVIFETGTRDTAEQLVTKLLTAGYTSFIFNFVGDAADGASFTVPDHPRKEEAKITLIGKDTEPEKLLRMANFPGAVSDACCVVVGDGGPMGTQGPTADALLSLCKERRVPAFALDGIADTLPATGDQAEEMLGVSAKVLFGSLRTGRRFCKK